ncbi:MAG: PD-(D/E)XK nuclease family protein [Kiritimatiellales bacterium]|nr:PD-(D/E)XK nuclease family protein [Kiritimatiellales bacterium]
MALLDQAAPRRRTRTASCFASGSFKSGVERLSPASGPPYSKPLQQPSKSAVQPAHSKSYIAGHIDLLQWKFDTLYILDFKPNARKERKQKVASQLLLYAIALSVRTAVPMERMRCAWFDGEDFFSFAPWSAQA